MSERRDFLCERWGILSERMDFLCEREENDDDRGRVLSAREGFFFKSGNDGIEENRMGLCITYI